MKKLFLMLVSVLIAISANATIYVVGDGEGLTWDLPGKSYEAGADGKYVLQINNLTNFKFSTNNSTEWDGDGSFNAGAYATGNSTFGEAVYTNANGQTMSIEPWGENQYVPWTGNYTITIDLNAMTMTAKTTTPKPTNAPAVYIRGDMNGWGSSADWQFTNKSWDGSSGVYTFTGTINAGVIFKIADATWGQINYTTNSTATKADGTPQNLIFNSGNMAMAETFTGTITLNITNYNSHVATVTFVASGSAPSYPDFIYCIGELKDCGWDPTKGLKMNSTGEGIYSAEVEITGSYFAFATKLGSNSSDWGGLGTRYGATEADQPVILDQNMTIAITNDNYSFKTDPGTYTITVSLKDMTMLVKKSAVTNYPTTMYVLGNVNGQDWSPTNGVAMNNTGTGTFEIKNLQIGNAGDDTGYFSFTQSLSNNADNWDGLGTRYGATEDGLSASTNGTYTLVYGQNAFKVGGDVTMDIALDLVNMNITISNYKATTTEPEPGPTPDLGEEIDVTYNFESLADVQQYNSTIPDSSSSAWVADGSNKKYYIDNLKLENGGVTIIPEGTGSSIYFYSSKYDFRITADNTITVSVPNGYILDEIVFRGSSLASTINKIVTTDPSLYGTLTQAGSGSGNITMTWTAPEASEFNKVIFGTSGSTSTRIADINVKAHRVASAEEPLPEVPEGAYTVYTRGAVNNDLQVYDWWNGSWNFEANNPTGSEKVFSFTPTVAGSMGIEMNKTPNTGILHDATLNFGWYATTENTQYTVKLNAGSSIEETYTFDVTADNVNQWNQVSLPMATTFPKVAEAWNNNANLGQGYVFSIQLVNYVEGAAVYFDNIYYTNVDNSWEAPSVEIPAPETVPVPTQAVTDVLSVFSSAYDSPTNFIIGNWGQSTQVEEQTIDEQKVEWLRNFNYLGWELTSNINISDYDYMHVDFWTSTEGAGFEVTPISPGDPAKELLWKATTVTANEWNQYDIDLSYFSNGGVDLANIFQIKYAGGIAGQDGYIANVFFYKDVNKEPVEPTYSIKGQMSGELTLEGTVATYTGSPNAAAFYIEKNDNGTITTYGPAATPYDITTYGTYQGAETDQSWVLAATIATGNNEMKISFDTETLKLTVSPVVSAVYVVGAGDGLTWDLPGAKFETVDNVATIKINNLSKFKASVNNTTEWDGEGSFNAGCYATGATTFGNEVYPDGQTLPIEVWGQDQELPWTGDYTITMDFNTMTMTAVTTTEQPTEAPAVYIRGAMNDWGAPENWQFTNVSWDSATSTGEFTLECQIAAGVEFKIANEDWSSINYGGVTSIVANEWVDLEYNSGTNMTLASAFDGTVTFKITGDKTATIMFEMEGEAPLPEKFYVIGTLADGAWVPNVGVEMTGNGEGIYTANEVVLVEANGSTGFAITANLGTTDSDWSTVNAMRFGPAEQDAEAVIGVNSDIATGDRSWTIEPGTYAMVFDYNNLTLTISESKGDGVYGIGADEADAKYFTIDGVRVQNPENGIYIKVVGSKASKVVINK